MGKHKLRLAHMIPNAWFYRLQDMTTKPLPSAYSSSTSKHHNHPRNSISYTPKVYTTKQPLYTQPTEPTDHTHQDSFLSPSSSGYKYPSSESTRSLDTPPSTSCNSGLTASTNDLQKLPPIITKTTKTFMDVRSSMVDRNEETCSQTPGRQQVSGIKIRSNSSKTRVCKGMVDDNDDDKRQKKLSSRCCIVKSTFDPEKDLKESMVEMIMENNIRESKDLEQLLAYYLSLNPNEYHDMIVKACEEIWLSFNYSVQKF
ncbi:hypothetical protein LXL04_019296 [Taraxacum kok-saghyz]